MRNPLAPSLNSRRLDLSMKLAELFEPVLQSRGIVRGASGQITSCSVCSVDHGFRILAHLGGLLRTSWRALLSGLLPSHLRCSFAVFRNGCPRSVEATLE